MIMDEKNITSSREVKNALKEGKPIVALETTIISHGMPYPKNYETAKNVESIIKDNGVTPATIGIIKGQIKIGLNDDEKLMFASGKSEIVKTSRRDIPFIISQGKNGATTVAGTMLLASLAGIKIMATGGIGGVHLDANNTFDISADLQELAKTDVTVICAGPKSILDIGLTLEYLETMGVPIIGYQSEILPSFYSRESNFCVDYKCDTPQEIASAIKIKKKLKIKGGVLVCNPIEKEHSISKEKLDKVIQKSLQNAKFKNVKGKDLTPFLLSEVEKLTSGESLESNINLMLSNAKLSSKIAKLF